jgi:phage terminase large subunit-like protein
MADRRGNAAKRLEESAPPPWESWPETERGERCIRFIQSYCRPSKGHGAGEPLRLARFQTDFVRLSYEDRVRASALSISRGNGKSSLEAGMACHGLFDADPEGGAPQIPVVATTLGQINRSVYSVILSFIENEPELFDRALIFSGIGTQRIRTPHNGGELFPVSKDLAGLQGLDPSFAVVDELGFMPLESWTALLLASGKRPRSLVVGIGTPGVDRDNALWVLRDMPELPAGFRFVEIAAPDGCALEDRDAWYTANPAIAAGFLSVDALETDVMMTPEEDFRRFRLGCWVEGVGSWLGEDAAVLWRALCDPYEMVDRAPTWVGVDVGLKHDSTAVAWVQRRPDGRLHVQVKIWDPRKDGRLETSDIMQFLRDLGLTYDVNSVCYDPRSFELAGAHLLDEGLPMIVVHQGVETMTPIVGSTYEALRRREVTHDDDRLFERHVLAAQTRPNERGFTLSKGKSKEKIDACIAMCLAVHEALVPDPAPRELVPFFGVTL